MAETDASMGFSGLPQSATGQTTLWTGTNGMQAMGRHKTGFPGPTLIRVLEEYGMLKLLNESGRSATLLNAYSEKYLERVAERPRLMSCSTHLQRGSGLPLKRLDDLAAGDALFMDITHEIMHKVYPELEETFPVIPAYTRGKDLLQISRSRGYDLCIHEFFLTDKAGHDQDFEFAAWTIRTLEEFLAGICENLDPENELLIVTSDHGNLEDLSTKTHTHNPVPTYVFGEPERARRLAGRIQRLSDIVPTIYEELGAQDLIARLPDPEANPDPAAA